MKGLRGLIPSTADQFRRAGDEKRIKERNDGWPPLLHFLAWIYGAGERTKLMGKDGVAKVYLLCVCVYVHVGVCGLQHWKIFRNAELDRNRKSEEKKQEIEARGVSLSVPTCGRRCIRLYVGRWVGDRVGLACRAGQGHACGAGQQGSTAEACLEASCQLSQKIDAAALACRQVTGPPPLPSPSLPLPSSTFLSSLPLPFLSYSHTQC